MVLTLDDIRKFFSRYQPKAKKSLDVKHAAVLIPLFLKNGQIHVLFTKRTENVEHHKGQISFPGGAMDSNDRDAVETATREAEEETGLGRKELEIIGRFDTHSSPAGFEITPVVAFVQSMPQLRPNRHEVEEIFDVPLSFFLDEANEAKIQILNDGRPRDVYFYHYGDYEIWGVTAGILRSLLKAILKDTPRAGRSGRTDGSG